MKVGYRMPSPSKSLKAKTSGRMTRSIKSSANPLYGKKGMGYVNNPKRAVKNAVYNRTTTSATSSVGRSSRNGSARTNDHASSRSGGATPGLVSFLVAIPIIAVIGVFIWILSKLHGALFG